MLKAHEAGTQTPFSVQVTTVLQTRQRIPAHDSSVSPPTECIWDWLFPEYSTHPHLHLRPPGPIWILRKQ